MFYSLPYATVYIHPSCHNRSTQKCCRPTTDGIARCTVPRPPASPGHGIRLCSYACPTQGIPERAQGNKMLEPPGHTQPTTPRPCAICPQVFLDRAEERHHSSIPLLHHTNPPATYRLTWHTQSALVVEPCSQTLHVQKKNVWDSNALRCTPAHPHSLTSDSVYNLRPCSSRQTSSGPRPPPPNPCLPQAEQPPVILLENTCAPAPPCCC